MTTAKTVTNRTPYITSIGNALETYRKKMLIATQCLRAKTQNLARCPITRD